MSGQGHAAPVVPLEVKRLIACHNTGETVLHKAARLGYPVSALLTYVLVRSQID